MSYEGDEEGGIVELVMRGREGVANLLIAV